MVSRATSSYGYTWKFETERALTNLWFSRLSPHGASRDTSNILKYHIS